MKRFLLLGLLPVLIGAWMAASCSNPLETTPPPQPPGTFRDVDSIMITDTLIMTDSVNFSDTVLIIDTVFVRDSTCIPDTVIGVDTVFVPDSGVVVDTVLVPDTVFVPDSVRIIDTVFVQDSGGVVDTVLVPDTVFVPDSIRVIDTVFVPDSGGVVDTVLVPDTVIVTDSTIVTDTVVVPDTIIVIDSSLVPDTVVIADTVFVGDTLLRVDTVVVTDTVIDVDTLVVNVPDSTVCEAFCAQIGSTQKYAVWLLDNAAGHYLLDFSAWAERDQPLQPMIISVNGQEQRWYPAADENLTLDVQLGADATIKLWLENPSAYGHSITVCLKVSPL